MDIEVSFLLIDSSIKIFTSEFNISTNSATPIFSIPKELTEIEHQIVIWKLRSRIQKLLILLNL